MEVALFLLAILLILSLVMGTVAVINNDSGVAIIFTLMALFCAVGLGFCLRDDTSSKGVYITAEHPVKTFAIRENGVVFQTPTEIVRRSDIKSYLLFQKALTDTNIVVMYRHYNVTNKLGLLSSTVQLKGIDY